ncbi:FABP family protein [Streptomyces sp. NPDC001941]|uniref:FABP family protein n=1 Tax=Streptomyces sp. NPDC001941 TaxID=3154659 RepID=UPI00332786CF
MFDPAPDYPYTATPEPHPLLAPVLGLLGSWSGRGSGEYPTLEEGFAYAQEVTFSHDGRPFLKYEARAWLVDGEGRPLRPSARESGWWRMQEGGRVEGLVTQPTGIAEVLVGTVDGGAADLVSEHVALTPTAKRVESTRRRYVLEDAGSLVFTHDMAAVGHDSRHHLAARLRRVAE